MRAEKKFISAEYLSRLNGSPFVIVVDYKGLTVTQFTALRKKLANTTAELHVVKNSIFRIAFKEAGLGDMGGSMAGQMAVVTGKKDISATAKVLKTFQSESDKPKIKFGFLGDKRLEMAEVQALADLPSIDVLRGKLLGLLQAPASQLARLISTPGAQVARVIKARVDKGE